MPPPIRPRSDASVISALIGSTGFVGSTLLQQATFDATYHSTDIAEIEGRTFDLGICAAAPAAKWKANKEPEADLANLERLMRHLGRARFGRLVLVSTVDVYPVPLGVDEESPIDAEAAGPYGRHRLLLERFAQERFDTAVIRLPGLFGRGLRKNAVYDLIHDNAVDALQPLSTFQFYDMSKLWSDIQRVQAKGLDTVNFATEPVMLGDLARELFGRRLAVSPSTPVHYDFRTRHGAAWGRTDGYMQGREEVVRRMRSFVEAERGGARP